MGCDAHMLAEVRRDGKWEAAGPIFDAWYDLDFVPAEGPLDEAGDPPTVAYTREGPGAPAVPNRLGELEGDRSKLLREPFKTEEPWQGRNYELFSALADVRQNTRGNGYIPPVSEPRGVPDDASPEYRALVERWGMDGHSHTHHTLAQLDAYDWDQPVEFGGVVGEDDYRRMREAGSAKPLDDMAYSAGVGGGGASTISQEAYDASDPPEPLGSVEQSVYVSMRWTEPLRENLPGSWFEALEKLRELGPPEDVRVVMLFDN